MNIKPWNEIGQVSYKTNQMQACDYGMSGSWFNTILLDLNVLFIMYMM